MNITHPSAHWKRLFQVEAIPGWAVLGWKLFAGLSTLQSIASCVQFLQSHLGGAWKFVTSPAGNVVLIVGGLLWLAAVAYWPRRAMPEKTAVTDKTWGDVMAEEDATNIQERVKQISQRREFHYDPVSDPYIDIITELFNGSVFDLVTFGEITGHGVYAGSQLATDPRVLASVEPVLVSIKHGKAAILTVRQFLSSAVADTMVANLNRGISVDFESVAVSFKMLSPTGPSQTYMWWGPRFMIDEAKRV